METTVLTSNTCVVLCGAIQALGLLCFWPAAGVPCSRIFWGDVPEVFTSESLWGCRENTIIRLKTLCYVSFLSSFKTSAVVLRWGHLDVFSISLAYQFGWLCRQLFLSYNFYVCFYVLFILYRFITQSEIFQVFISWNFDDYGLQIMTTQNSVSLLCRFLFQMGLG